jgi:MFS family permease
MGRRFILLASFPSLSRTNEYLLQELITSATTLGALLGGLVAGVLSDWTGRKLVLGIADVIFIGGAIAQAVSHNVWSMVRSCENTPTRKRDLTMF